MKTVYTITETYFGGGGVDLDDIRVGDELILVSHTNAMTGEEIYKLVPDNGGIGGNLDSSIKRYHGWRGTTSNWSVYAEGLRRVERVDPIKEHAGGYIRTVKVKLSGDLKPEEE